MSVTAAVILAGFFQFVLGKSAGWAANWAKDAAVGALGPENDLEKRLMAATKKWKSMLPDEFRGADFDPQIFWISEIAIDKNHQSERDVAEKLWNRESPLPEEFFSMLKHRLHMIQSDGKRHDRHLPAFMNASPELVDKWLKVFADRLREACVESDALGDSTRDKQLRRIERAVTDRPASAQLRQTRHNLPRRNPDFVGRDEDLTRIYEQLAPGNLTAEDSSSVKPYVLTGMGGVGKTHIALEYAYRHLRGYKKVCWIDAEGTDVTAGFAGLARLFALSFPKQMTTEERATEVLAALQSGGPYLVIFDNVDMPPAIERWLPRTGSAKVLITTRCTSIPGTTVGAVPVLPEEAALELLDARSDRQGALDLCRELGFLALAVAVARGLLQDGAFTPASLLEQIREAGPVETFETIGEPVFEKHPSLIRLFDASVRQLDRSKQVDAWAEALLWAGGWFAPVGVPRALLTNAALYLRATEIGVFAPVAIARLVRLSLARAESREVTFHRLVQAYARHRGGQQARTATLDALAEEANHADDLHDLLKLAPMRPHFHAAVSAIEPGAPEAHIYIAKCLMMHLQYVAEFNLSNVVAEQMLAKLNDKHTVDFLHFIGMNLGAQEKHDDARGYHERELMIKERIYGPYHAEVAEALSAIGDTFEGQRCNEQARDYYLRSLKIRVHRFGPDAPEVAHTLRSIGITLESDGRSEDAARYFQDALEIQLKQDPDTRTAEDEKQIAYTLRLMGKRDEAPKHLRRALAIEEKTLGPRHPDVADTCRELGEELAVEMQYEQAL